MLGFSYGELFLLLGATAALIGPKDLPRIAKTVGRLAGRSIGYVQLARGQLESVMQQSQARQVHKELQDTMAQLEAIRHEIRSISFMNPGPLTTRLVDNIGNVKDASERNDTESTSATTTSQDNSFRTAAPLDIGSSQTTANAKLAESMTSKDEFFNMHSGANANAKLVDSATSKDQSLTKSASSDLHSQATAYARLAESTSLNSGSMNSDILSELTDESGHVIVLPVSAESAELLPKRKDDINGSDIVLEALLEAEVARNAKDFFSQPQNLQV